MHQHCKKVLLQTSFCAFTTMKLISFDVLQRKPQRRDQNIRCHVQFAWKARLVGFAFYYVVFF